ncbi:hypothetical protein EVAR_82429_1 [Eumeta japonica]|uniref:Uncharacterized protein n=1 Tax=Eumeta variegata TaxID=151549 RepID=A0A4C1YF67_EUMVA|nr:hypothetical protein EVAR_82429_1 [Eumeta japonica]
MYLDVQKWTAYEWTITKQKIFHTDVLFREYFASLPSRKAVAALFKEPNYACFKLDSVLNKTVTFEELNRETRFVSFDRARRRGADGRARPSRQRRRRRALGRSDAT